MPFFCFLILAIGLIYLYFKKSFDYWKKKKIITLPPAVPCGNLNNPLNPTDPLHVAIGRLYDLVKTKKEIHGGFYFFAKPIYVPVSTQLLRKIFAIDFSHFTGRGVYVNEKTDPLTVNLFGLHGTRWKNLRAKLTPTFTTGKIKMVFFIMLDSAKNMIRHIDESVQDNCLNVKEVMGCFTTDVIGSAAFGLDCNCFQDTESRFRYYGKKVFKGTARDQLAGLIGLLAPGLVRKLGLQLFNKEVSDFFLNLVKTSVEYREKNNVARKDFLQSLIDMKNANALTFNELAAQCFVFFIAGFETSSTTMTFALYEMALNPDVQEKARQEVLTVLRKRNGELTYDAAMEMKYLEQVLDETLRKYPALPIVNRKVTKTYKIPETDVTLEKGTLVFIPAYSVHHDPDYYPDPEKFDPDRFSEEGKQKIVPFSYMPFGEGPRMCIGIRFGVLQSKIGLALLLKNYKITMNAKTKVPIELDPITFVISSKDDILLNIEKISTK